MQRRILAAALGASLLLAAACGDERAADVTTSSVAVDTTVAADTTVGADSTVSVDSSVNASTTVAGSSGTIAVPGDFDTIQAAVDAAAPGALILVGPGTYNEAVNVTTDNLTIRGLDRNEVVLDGQLELDNGIRILGASGVTVENLTAMNYTRNGFFWTGVDGYRGAYLTAYRTGDYGVYVFDSMNGELEHIYAAGSPDAGVYIGECYPCNAVIDDAVSEHNGLGYSGTNSGGNLLIVNSTFRYNRAGVVPNSGSYELCYPERETTIVGNLVYSNNQADTPAIDVALLAMGNGILSAGGVLNDIERNLVYDHDKTGIGLVPFLEEDPNDSVPLPEEWSLTCAESKLVPPQDPGGGILWDSMQNRVIGNVLENNRVADLLVASAGTDVSSLGHCFTGNVYTTTAPNNLEVLAPCDATGSGDWSDGEYNVAAWLGETHPPSVAWQTAPLPALEQQVSMPDAATAPAHPATDVPKQIDLAAISVPAKPA
ncbi:MAG TPA: right-handed parallel beta-helix repeat-containing protein [Ilumatobacteraceae bacterium]|nr:right-handed parallel beta-helix repeat-containing protein [Ilumatobacteraceae bacterium]HQY86091.1 right-handed parallel beta-helix repeat-containing protein [Ilumatobacteraceae bacterium]HRA85740.1 right-handed parallel beta-helix repeat-containing protein [Ilumatobacteraceae bacterium]